MPQSKAHIKATNKWLANERDRIAIIVPKGRKAEIKVAADAKGQSLNSFINEAIDKRMEDYAETHDHD